MKRSHSAGKFHWSLVPASLPKSAWIALLFFCLLAEEANSQNAPAPRSSVTTARTGTPATSISATKQFVIHGADLNTRSAFTLLSDETSSSLGTLLKDNARFDVPVVINLHTPPDIAMTGPSVSIDMSVVENSVFHFGLIVQLRSDFRTEDYTRELVRVLLVERILRGHPQVQSSRRPILPDWLASGVMQALEFRGRSRPSAVFAAVFRSGKFYDVEKIFTVNPAALDAVSRTIFDISSCALVLSLLDQPDGPLRFTKFLSALATDSKTDRELLQQSFPNFSTSKNSLEKWWSLQMATLATPNALETLNIGDTESQLDDALTLHFEETPEDAAKSSKKSSGFFGLFSSEKIKDKPAPASKGKTEETKKAEPEKTGDKPKITRFFHGLFGGKTESEKADKDKKSSPDNTSKKEKTADPNEKPAQTGMSPAPLFGGHYVLMPTPSRGSNEVKDDSSSASSDTGEKASAPSKKSPPAETPDKTEKKPSRYNPLNWFGKSAKKSEAAGTKPPAKVEPRKQEDNSARNAVITLADYQRIMARKDRNDILKHNLAQLNALQLRAHPMYKPLVNEYAKIVMRLMDGKDKGTSEKLDALRIRRSEIHELARAVESHLDWYEATQIQTRSGLFDDYLKLRDKLDKEVRPRSDAISKYLDSLEKEYE